MENYRIREPSVQKSLRLSRELWEQIIEFAEINNCRDFSDATRTLAEAGLWLESHKKDLQDPQKTQQLIDEYNQKLKEGSIFEWLDSLSSQQLEGLLSAIRLTKEKRNS